MIRYLLIDLDGTITDSAPGITHSVDYALKKVLNIHTDDLSSLNCYIGPPLIESFQVRHGASYEKAIECIEAYREYYQDKGINELSVYDEIPEMLKTLSDAGFRIAVATSKPEYYAKIILEKLSFDRYFECICGATLDGSINTKSEVISCAMTKLGNPDPSECLMIGDREHDAQGAHEHSIKTLGALWGFGSKEELLNAGAYLCFEKPSDMANWILQNK